ncbi:putative phosphoglycerate mutase [Rhizomicrobium palustre]|uniref:Putative phosphoglycerate mutase n=1 Tax=Rhizomicrobium palustre TaxID=189966 RepID=A0A846MXJ2_9PROT|nr:histidine phosphatase family protein [Rhizomicrobium palustre]NIK88116.1 putative phosphoglycerate mutase [Rhizomicrobium palustre]
MKLALLRHGPTEWNAEGRIQGTIDIPLSAAGFAKMSALLPPEGFETARRYCSPKLRARQTAECLGFTDPILDARLIEQNWGQWEGLTRAEMIARDGDDAFERAGAKRGVEFRPPGGESTGEVQARLQNFFTDIAAKGEDAIAVAHMGVLRAAYAIATQWDHSAPMPPELDVNAVVILNLTERGVPSIAALNVPFRVKAAAL